MSEVHEPAPSPALEQLLALARKSLTGGPPKRNAATALQLERAFVRRARRRRMLGCALGACCLLLGSLALFLWFRPEASVALRFDVINGALSSSGVVEGSPQGTQLRFSDGTALALTAHGRARVDSLSAHGAELGLERGSAKLDVVRRTGARWSVRAGPYLVSVTGTSFEVEFEPEQRWLKLDLLEGSVSVSGPLIDGALQVSAGQRLLVRPGDALVLVQRREAADVDPAAPNPVPSLEPPGAAGPSSATDGVNSKSDAHAPRGARATARARALAPSRVDESWSQKVAAGRFGEVITLAEARELGRVYREAALDDLEALADAARYARRVDVARPALLVLRQRFAGSRAAREAAFLLGRLDEGEGAAEAALAWYDRYLSDDSGGAYASQALGRKLLLLRQRSAEQAQAVAREYLRRFPQGPYAATARELSRAR